MNTALTKLLVLTNALLLALPAGWCCVINPGQAEETPVVHSCCGSEPVEPADGNSPQPAGRDCCCQTDWTPSSAEPRILTQTIAPTLAIDLIGLELESSSVFSTPFSISSPPFRILQCVWRC